MSTNRFYNYVILDPRKPGQFSYNGLAISFLYEPFYVGKGCNSGRSKRKYAHLNKFHLRCRSRKNAKIKAILRTGVDLKPFILQINDNMIESDTFDIERNMIRIIGRLDFGSGPLTNGTDGGDGGSGASPELRKRFGSPKEKHPLWQKGHREESKQKISLNHADCSGSNNSRAACWKIISNSGDIFEIKGNLKEFVESRGFSFATVRKYINKGKIPPPDIKHRRKQRMFMIGWEFIHL